MASQKNEIGEKVAYPLRMPNTKPTRAEYRGFTITARCLRQLLVVCTCCDRTTTYKVTCTKVTKDIVTSTVKKHFKTHRISEEQMARLKGWLQEPVDFPFYFGDEDDGMLRVGPKIFVAHTECPKCKEGIEVTHGCFDMVPETIKEVIDSHKAEGECFTLSRPEVGQDSAGVHRGYILRAFCDKAGYMSIATCPVCQAADIAVASKSWVICARAIREAIGKHHKANDHDS